MPKAWFCIPSARPVAEVAPIVKAWKDQGYGVALLRSFTSPDIPDVDVLVKEPVYPGYAESVNYLARLVLNTYPEVDWIVAGGDDTFPDPNKTGDEIAEELYGEFVGRWSAIGGRDAATFGVMQPTGDPWSDNQGRIIERIAGSPWMGREWCRRANAGKGPMWPEFRHMYGDEFLQLYAQHLGVFLQRPDLLHHHAHAQRGGVGKPAGHMKEWNSQAHWVESKAIFERLKAGNFEECKPIA